MKLTIYTADCTGDAANCLYPHKMEPTNAAELAKAVSRDHVAALYLNNYRSPHRRSGRVGDAGEAGGGS